MSSTDQLCAVVNFYEKITPPPDFSTFVDGWKCLGKYVETLDHYIAAQLHRNVEAKGKLQMGIIDQDSTCYSSYVPTAKFWSFPLFF